MITSTQLKKKGYKLEIQVQRMQIEVFDMQINSKRRK
jgi:hypothetical protein